MPSVYSTLSTCTAVVVNSEAKQNVCVCSSVALISHFMLHSYWLESRRMLLQHQIVGSFWIADTGINLSQAIFGCKTVTTAIIEPLSPKISPRFIYIFRVVQPKNTRCIPVIKQSQTGIDAIFKRVFFIKGDLCLQNISWTKCRCHFLHLNI